MEIRGNTLSLGERMTLRQLLRGKAGNVTVREAREFIAPTGRGFVFQVVGVTLLALCLAAVFMPFLLVAAAAPFVLVFRQRARVVRWAKLLPPDRDGEPVALV